MTKHSRIRPWPPSRRKAAAAAKPPRPRLLAAILAASAPIFLAGRSIADGSSAIRADDARSPEGPAVPPPVSGGGTCDRDRDGAGGFRSGRGGREGGGRRTDPPPLGGAAASTAVALPGGAEMPIVGLGGGIFTGDAEVAVLSALGAGYRLVDTAPNYRTEGPIGRALRRSGISRSDVFLQSKVPNVGYDGAVSSLNRTLDELGTDYLDLLLLHGAAARGGGGTSDPSSPRHARRRLETWRAMSDALRSGLVRSIGVCNLSPRQMEALLDVASPSVLQMEFHPALQRNGTLEWCLERGVAVQGYGSGGGARRKGRRRTGPDFLGSAPVLDAARAHGVTPNQAVLRWTLQRGVAVIPLSTDPAHQRENLRLFHFELSPDEMASISALDGRRGGEDDGGGTARARGGGVDTRSVYGFVDPDTIA